MSQHGSCMVLEFCWQEVPPPELLVQLPSDQLLASSPSSPPCWPFSRPSLQLCSKHCSASVFPPKKQQCKQDSCHLRRAGKQLCETGVLLKPQQAQELMLPAKCWSYSTASGVMGKNAVAHHATRKVTSARGSLKARSTHSGAGAACNEHSASSPLP